MLVDDRGSSARVVHSASLLSSLFLAICELLPKNSFLDKPFWAAPELKAGNT